MNHIQRAPFVHPRPELTSHVVTESSQSMSYSSGNANPCGSVTARGQVALFADHHPVLTGRLSYLPRASPHCTRRIRCYESEAAIDSSSGTAGCCAGCDIANLLGVRPRR